MGLRERLRGENRTSGNVPDPATCPHDSLVPRWRGPEVMNDDSLAMGFICHRCHSEFLPYQVENRRTRAR